MSCTFSAINIDDWSGNKIAFGNNLQVNKTRDNFYLFSRGDESPTQTNSSLDNSGSIKQQRPIKSRKSNFYFTILDKENKLLDIDVENTPIANIISDIGNELDINIFISTPLENAGTTTVKAKNITFDDLLNKIWFILKPPENYPYFMENLGWGGFYTLKSHPWTNT